MEHIIGITNARNNIKEIVDAISDKNDTYIVTRGCVPEAVIISYKRHMEYKKLLDIVEELKYEKSIKKSQLQFKEWLDQKGFDTSRISEEEIGDMIKNLQINDNNS
jgi:prevent-host-death family protein